MKKTGAISVLFVVCMTMLWANIAFAQRGRIDDRIREQWHHIDRALSHGRITERQADYLHDNLRHIRHEFEMERNSGTLNFDKIRWLNRELNHNEMKLERMKEGGSSGPHHRYYH
ncbi:MAG: hypothetical protein P4L43_15770 [Syntrophobacteraceae bacterium]|nr:hypothetical protein [Syntrophobacteraceae bacterium]